MITTKEIENAIDTAVEKVIAFKGSKLDLIAQIINPLQAKLRVGVKAGLKCSEKSIKAKFAKLQKALEAKT